MQHPLESIPRSKRKRIFWSLLTATLGWMVMMQVVNSPLITPKAPQGIISLELAGSFGKVKWILAAWDVRAQKYAALGLGLDYVFMLLYSTTIAVACLWAGETLRAQRWPLGSLGTGLAWGQWAAAILDAVENIALIALLFGSLSFSRWPELASIYAWLKFSLIFLGLGYAFYGLMAYLFRKR
jgi:hypothetical protein